MSIKTLEGSHGPNKYTFTEVYQETRFKDESYCSPIITYRASAGTSWEPSTGKPFELYVYLSVCECGWTSRVSPNWSAHMGEVLNHASEAK